MNFEMLLKATDDLNTPLEASAMVLVQALKAAGVDDGQVTEVQRLLHDALPRLDDESADVLNRVLLHRLAEALAHGAYYGTVKLAGSLTMVEAHILHDALKQSGVANRIRHDHLTGNSFPNLGDDVEIWVYPGDLEKAKGIYSETQSTSTETTKCGNCGEENPGHFGRCWNCGSALTEAASEG